MNKKPARTGPKLRITRPANRVRKPDEAPLSTVATDQSKFVYTCQYCCLKFTHNSKFFRHMMTNHQLQQKQATFECNECQIVFSKKSILDLHCQTNHQVKSKSRCESCAITFKSRYCLRRHMMLKQQLQENSCIKCQKKYTNKDWLTKHVQNKHTSKYVTYHCDLCSLKFKAKESLRSHLLRVHKRL